MMAPYDEDQAVCALAESLGLVFDRREQIEITDIAALEQNGLTRTRTTPDYTAIRRALNAGAIVQGARRVGIEYVLRRAGEK